ncbi:fasciclin domain-containing protein [Methylocapsa acidiphila]|uniref:fasciclin domain-containing protein n=1 Tax=Methylocapsa acidiphila TaxID=133552 RepID=UPI0004142762|nr:fasciclin domain-containing protein [Methylocapsa acidiphila]
MNSIRRAALAVALGAAALSPAAAHAEMTVEVGGAPMYPSRTIVENAAASKDLSALFTGLKAADLVAALEGDGPFTVLAPVNKAFEKMPKGALDDLMKPDNKPALTAILAYHVIPGKYSAADLVAAIKKGGGRATLKTLEGEDLAVEHDGRKLIIVDAKGAKAIVTIPDVNQKNGVIHVIDAVLSPKG